MLKKSDIILQMPDESEVVASPEIETLSGEISLLRKNEGWKYPAAILFSIFLGIVIFKFIYTDPTISNIQSNIIGIAPPLLPLLFVIFGFDYLFTKKANRLFMQQIAAVLGYTYEEKPQPITTAGSIFTVGYDHSVTDVFSGTYTNLPIHIFTYSYTVGTGKSSTQERANIISLSFPNTFPHVEFNIQMITEHAGLFFHTETEPVELEGNFDTQFKLRVSKGMQMEIRELFQPNVMDEIKNKYSDFGFELYENTLYFVHFTFPEEREKWIEYVQRAQKLIDLLMPGLQEISIKN